MSSGATPGSAATPRRQLHVRTVRMEAFETETGDLELTGTLRDERPQGGRWFGALGPALIHDMAVTLRIRRADLVITAASGGMTAHPYIICTDAVPALQRLVGLSVARGFMRALNEQMGRQRGCAHLASLVQAMAPVVRQSIGVSDDDDAGPPPDAAWFVDTCQAWRADGPLHSRLVAGDAQGLQALSAYPPPPES